MASGNGLSYLEIEIDNEKFPTYDLVLCAKFKDICGFFSFRELFYNKNYNIKNSEFIYNQNYKDKISNSTALELNEDNDFIGIQNQKIINKKKNLQNLFKLDETTLTDDDNRLIEKIFRYSNSDYKIISELQMFINEKNNVNKQYNFLTDDHLEKINKKAMKDKVFIFRSIVKNKYDSFLSKDNKPYTTDMKKKCLEKILKTLGKNFIHPKDLANLYGFLSIKYDDMELIYLRQQNLPRLSSKGLLRKILTYKGVKELDHGALCYDIDYERVDPEESIDEMGRRREIVNKYDEKEQKLLEEKYFEDERRELEEKMKEEKRKIELEEKEKSKIRKYGLFSNIEIKNDIIVKLNFETFNKYLTKANKFCDPDNFKIDDAFVGKFEDGYYNLICLDDLRTIQEKEIEFFINAIQTTKPEINLINYYKKKMIYPRHYGDFLIIRDSIIQPPFVQEQTAPDPEMYTRGFITTLQSIYVRKTSYNFGYRLLESLFKFITKNYKDYYIVRGPFRENYNQLYNFLFTNSKLYAYKIIQNMFEIITGLKNPVKSVVAFFDNKKLKKISKDKDLIILVVMAYFITCNKEKDKCNYIKIKDDKHQVVTILDNKIYFDANEVYPTFKDTDLERKTIA